MAAQLSYQHAVNLISLLYERESFELHGSTPGQQITAEFGQRTSQARFGALFAFIDEIIFILRYQNYYLTSCVSQPSNHHAVTHLRFCAGMLSTLSSVRVLSGMGLDLNARVQLRYLYELSILWSRIHVDDEARQEFSLTSFQETNAYWHKYLSKRKSEKYLFSEAASGRFTWVGASGKHHIDNIYDRLSLSGHPGFWGLSFEASADLSIFEDGLVVRGAEAASIFTLSAAILLSLLPFGIDGITDWGFEAPELFDPKKIYPASSRVTDWRGYSFDLRKMILAIGLFSFGFSSELGGKPWFKQTPD